MPTKLSGAPSLLTIIALSAFMPIIYKTTDGILENTITNIFNALTGRKTKILSQLKKLAVLKE